MYYLQTEILYGNVAQWALFFAMSKF